MVAPPGRAETVPEAKGIGAEAVATQTTSAPPVAPRTQPRSRKAPKRSAALRAYSPFATGAGLRGLLT